MNAEQFVKERYPNAKAINDDEYTGYWIVDGNGLSYDYLAWGFTIANAWDRAKISIEKIEIKKPL